MGGEEAEGRDEEVAWEKVRKGKEQFEFTPSLPKYSKLCHFRQI